MPLICTNLYIHVYQMDSVINGNAHALFAAYATKSDFQLDRPALFKDHIDFTFDSSLGTSIEVQAENAIKLLNQFLSCVTE